MLEDPARGFPEALRRHRPRIVAVYEDNFNFLSKMCLTRMREVAFSLSEASKAAGAITLVNGSDATDHLDEYLHRGFDFALLGEAEWSLLELVQSLLGTEHGTDPQAIQGLAFLERPRRRVLRSPARALMRNLDALPFPARDLVDVERYRSVWQGAHGCFSLNLVASRGCPYRCNWCAKPIYGNSFHLRSAESVAEEMRELKQVYGAEHLWFADDIFALKSQWAMDLAEAAEWRDAALPFKVQSRVDLMNPQTVGALARAGCAEMWMGVESGAQNILNAMDKGTRVEQVGPARELLREHSIRACYFLQFGYPGETWKDIQRTVALLRRTRPDDIGVSVSYPLPGTEFYTRVREQLGEKTNWTDSEDLSIMFKSPYTDEFYRALRDALHAEVDAWSLGAGREADAASKSAPAPGRSSEVRERWARVEALERTCRNPDPTLLPVLQWSEAVT